MSSPALSAIIVTADTFEPLRKAVRCLAKQTCRDQIELVIVSPSNQQLKPDPALLKAFNWVSLVEIGEFDSTSMARAVGIRRATAPVIVFCESHAFPERHWAEVLLEAHRQPCAAVGPLVINGNPKNILSWADFFLSHGGAAAVIPGEIREDIPGRNSSYKTEVLLAYGDQLEGWLEMERFLHRDLRLKGHQLRLDPRARVYHLNGSEFIYGLQTHFHLGRLFGAARCQQEHWSVVRRVVYTAGSALIPVLRLWRLMSRLVCSKKLLPVAVKALPMMVILASVSAFGEAVGYLFGGGTSRRWICAMELDLNHR